MHRDQRIPWHKLLGQALADALTGLPYQVSTEEELALRSQRLDVLIIEQGESPDATGRPAEDRPDGLEDLTKRVLGTVYLISLLFTLRIPGTANSADSLLNFPA
ncbi:hypothetical protein Thiowin_04396 [Thiorhodovibrio winogradskyi]|uniref:Uncharacterized protein n=1 Tax=Thiorhodovibrio winogradskyi TaxID=77007 RepID=A0ABZ0SF28_9GAMM|nr:hypothetical protein [Thiorhodovibrio winogradskyi]